MYEVKVSADSQGMTTHELVFDDAERSPIEKNWMRFEHKGVSYYIRSLHPYIVPIGKQTNNFDTSRAHRAYGNFPESM